jgi:hypothetical protein
MKALLLLCLLSVGLFAQEPTWKTSVAVLAVSATLDTVSSWGQYEENPILGNGKFGLRQTGIKAGITGGSILTEWLWLRKHPKDHKIFMILNLSSSGALIGVSIHNWSIR